MCLKFIRCFSVRLYATAVYVTSIFSVLCNKRCFLFFKKETT